MAVMVTNGKIFNNDNLGEFVLLSPCFTRIWHQIHLNYYNLPLAYHHSHSMAATLHFTSFFTIAFLGLHTFFTAGLLWIRFHFFL